MPEAEHPSCPCAVLKVALCTHCAGAGQKYSACNLWQCEGPHSVSSARCYDALEPGLDSTQDMHRYFMTGLMYCLYRAVTDSFEFPKVVLATALSMPSLDLALTDSSWTCGQNVIPFSRVTPKTYRVFSTGIGMPLSVAMRLGGILPGEQCEKCEATFAMVHLHPIGC